MSDLSKKVLNDLARELKATPGTKIKAIAGWLRYKSERKYKQGLAEWVKSNRELSVKMRKEYEALCRKSGINPYPSTGNINSGSFKLYGVSGDV